MAHAAQYEFFSRVAAHLPAFFSNRLVLEIGSVDQRGSVRDLFSNCNYIGVDVSAGPSVDLVAQGQLLSFEAESFDTVLSAEAMEHNPFWRETFANMLRLSKSGGLVLMTCAAPGRPEHGTSRTTPDDSLTPLIGWEYYRNLSSADFIAAAHLDGWFERYAFFTNWEHLDL